MKSLWARGSDKYERRCTCTILCFIKNILFSNYHDWFAFIAFAWMIKFKDLAWFPVNRLSHSVMPVFFFFFFFFFFFYYFSTSFLHSFVINCFIIITALPKLAILLRTINFCFDIMSPYCIIKRDFISFVRFALCNHIQVISCEISFVCHLN